MHSGSVESRDLFPGALEMMILQILRRQPDLVAGAEVGHLTQVVLERTDEIAEQAQA